MADLVNCDCGERAKVTESRTILTEQGVTIWRRKVCHYGKPIRNARCNFNLMTVEVQYHGSLPNAFRR